MNKLTYIFYFFLFFAILYSESIEIGTLRLSQLWKIPLLMYMIIIVLGHHVKNRETFIKAYYAYGFIKLMNRGWFINIFTIIQDFSKFIFFPVLYDFIKIKIRSEKTIYNFLLILSLYITASFIPFNLGILRSNYVQGTEHFVAQGHSSGIFLSPHIASLIVSIALIILVYHIRRYRMPFKIASFFYILIAMGLWGLFLTYARQGYLAFALGVTFILMPKKITIKQFSSFVLIICGAYFVISYLFETNDFFRYRLLDLDSNGYKADKTSYGSGRTVFWYISWMFWLHSPNLYTYLFGQGLDSLMDYQLANYGLRIYSHNGFIDSLAQNGLIGFVLFSSFYICLLKNVFKCKKSKYFRLTLVIILMCLSTEMTQGIVSPYIYLLLVLAIRLILLDSKNNNI